LGKPDHSNTSDKKPHYLGHRSRLKERFQSAPGALPDYELLELFLGWLYPRKDVKPLAKELLEEYGSLWSVFHNPKNSPCAVGFLCVRELCRRLIIKEIQGRPLLNSLSKVLEYCHLTMGHLTYETFHLFFLDRKNFLIQEESFQKGTLDEVALYPRNVMARALEVNAAGLILVHNHPSGDPTPSKSDVLLTQHLVEVLGPFKIQVLDHLIIGKYAHFSFREQNILFKKTNP